MNRTIPFAELNTADLIIDAIYEGGTSGNLGDDPLSKLIYCGNQGGFRKVGRPTTKYALLYSSLEDTDWPDSLDMSIGIFTYYGDNKTSGSLLHQTKQGGNKLLSEIYSKLHNTPPQRGQIPPLFIFTKFATISGRSVQFRGLAVPGARGISVTDDLVAIWKSTKGQRFQNYKAILTILDVPTIPRAWIDDLFRGEPMSANAPTAWREWVGNGPYRPLTARPTIQYRTIAEQMPATEVEKQIILAIYDHFIDHPVLFEHCAAALVNKLDANYIVDAITRPTADGGRDVIGRYKLGPLSDPIYMDFALEAKCYDPGLRGNRPNTIGVRETSRLISRLRFRQFGILITTSVISRQAYEEVRTDGHPVILMCGRDIARLLMNKGISTRNAVQEWLQGEFPAQQNKKS
jgi:hypothetical protein